MKMVVYVKGGVIQGVISDVPCELLVVDQDQDGTPERELQTYQDDDGDKYRASGYFFSPVTINKEMVKKCWKIAGNAPSNGLH